MNEKNRLVSIIALLVATVFVTSVLVSAQEFPSNLSTNTPPPPLPTNRPPPLPFSNRMQGTTRAAWLRFPRWKIARWHREPARALCELSLPKDDGQYWVEYDLKPYTRNLTKVEQPQQAIIDWILRETGTDVWFSQPMGVLNADRDTLRCLSQSSDAKDGQRNLRTLCQRLDRPPSFWDAIDHYQQSQLANTSAGWMKSVQVQSPGVHAWLLSKENTALLFGHAARSFRLSRSSSWRHHDQQRPDADPRTTSQSQLRPRVSTNRARLASLCS